MGRPKDPDADISNRSDTDTMRSTSSTGSRKVVRHRVWDRVLTANDLVNGKLRIEALRMLKIAGHWFGCLSSSIYLSYLCLPVTL